MRKDVQTVFERMIHWRKLAVPTATDLEIKDWNPGSTGDKEWTRYTIRNINGNPIGTLSDFHSHSTIIECMRAVTSIYIEMIEQREEA